jgi:glucuronoarabinoxylan endo-1,4-beta-xylanase
MRTTCALALTLTLLPCAASRSATVTINPAVTYQTMEGLGVAVPQWLYAANNTTAMANLMVNDLGATMLRVYPEDDFEPSLGQFRPTATNTATQFAVVQKAVAAGLPHVILSVFSPPAWMKDNNSLVNGGHLLPSMYQPYAEYYSRYVQAMNAAVGPNAVYAVSPENEPEWAQWYTSCIFSYTEMRDAVKAIGLRLEADGLPGVKMFSAETVVSANWGPYYGTTMADTAAARILDVLAVHAYENNGVTASSPSASTWRRVRDAAKQRDKTAWMTETSGFNATFGDALTYANGLYTALKYGELSGWVFLTFNTPTGANEQEALVINGTPKPIYYTSKNYYKWIRPGAVQVDAVSSDTNVLAIAFAHATNATMTIVMTNRGSSSASVTLSGSGLPSTFQAFRSSASQNCVSIAAVSGGSLTLPGQSITTLFATGYVTAVREPARAALRSARADLSGPHEVFSLSGRRVATETRGRAGGAGVYCVRALGHGSNVIPTVR